MDNPYYTSWYNEMIWADRSLAYLYSVKTPEYANHILDWDLQNKINSENFEVLDYLQFGKMMSSVFQDEIAYQCYYLAHLKDHQNIGANSKMPFDKL